MLLKQKKMLAPWKKTYDQPRQHMKEQRHYFADKGQYSQSSGFSSSHVQMWELNYKEGWMPKNWCFWTVVLEKTLESESLGLQGDPTSPFWRRSTLGCSLEGITLKLRLQYFGHFMWRVDSLEKTLMLGRIGTGGEGNDRGWDGCMASLTRWTWVWVNSRSWWWAGRPGVLWFMESQRVRHDWATELNSKACRIQSGI